VARENSFIQKHQEIWKFIKFTFTGLSTTLLYYAVYYLMYYVIFKSLNNVPVTDNAVLSFLGIQYKGDMYEFFIASLISYVASYIMNRKMTFHADSNLLLSTILYFIMVIVTVAFSTWFGAFMMSWVRNNGHENFFVVTLVNLIVILVPFLWTYPLQRFVIHRKKNDPDDDQKNEETIPEENA
jgi:putative flippase GtrA